MCPPGDSETDGQGGDGVWGAGLTSESVYSRYKKGYPEPSEGRKGRAGGVEETDVCIWPSRYADGVARASRDSFLLQEQQGAGRSPLAVGQGCDVQLTFRPLRHMQIWQGR